MKNAETLPKTSPDIPDHLKCPISHEMFVDPVRTADGLTYERAHITRWLQDHNTSPRTNALLIDKTLTPDAQKRNEVRDYLNFKNNTQRLLAMHLVHEVHCKHPETIANTPFSAIASGVETTIAQPFVEKAILTSYENYYEQEQRKLKDDLNNSNNNRTPVEPPPPANLSMTESSILTTSLLAVQSENHAVSVVEPLWENASASGSLEGNIKIFNQGSAETIDCELPSPAGQKGPITCLLYLPNNKKLISISTGTLMLNERKTLICEMRIWDLAKKPYDYLMTINQFTTNNKPHTEQILDLKALSHGRQVATCSRDKTIRIWDTETWQCIQILNGESGHSKAVLRLAVLSANTFASCSKDKTIKLWQLRESNDNSMSKKWQCIKTLSEHTGDVFYLQTLSNNRFASCAADLSIKIWDIDTATAIQTLHGNLLFTCLCELDTHRIASGLEDGQIEIWDIKSGQCTHTLTGLAQPIVSIQKSPDNKIVAVAADQSTFECVIPINDDADDKILLKDNLKCPPK